MSLLTRLIKKFTPVSATSGVNFEKGRQWNAVASTARSSGIIESGENPLRDFFERRKVGPGIWKWTHYFDIYHQHLKKFRGRPVHVLEVGIYSGGSLQMWREYFGPDAVLYGVDIEPSCKAYEDDKTHIFIGDQQDRAFWKSVIGKIPQIDVIIDDGGHYFKQQIVTLEEALSPGGVFICEDVHTARNEFAMFVYGLADRLNDAEMQSDESSDERRLTTKAQGPQQFVKSVSLYPFVTVIERTDRHVFEFVAPKHGTEWQPFLK